MHMVTTWTADSLILTADYCRIKLNNQLTQGYEWRVTFQVDTLSNHPLWIRVKKQHIFMIILNKMCRSDAPW